MRKEHTASQVLICSMVAIVTLMWELLTIEDLDQLDAIDITRKARQGSRGSQPLLLL